MVLKKRFTQHPEFSVIDAPGVLFSTGQALDADYVIKLEI